MEGALTGCVVGTAFWLCIAAIVLVPMWLRRREQRWFHETIQGAMGTGQAVTPGFVDALAQGARARESLSIAEQDLRKGVLFLAAAIGTAILAYGLSFGILVEDEISDYITTAVAAAASGILAVIGLVHFGFWLFRRRTRAEGRPGEGTAG
jgi:hypothetical protein